MCNEDTNIMEWEAFSALTGFAILAAYNSND